jgi:hypothetical protein
MRRVGLGSWEDVMVTVVGGRLISSKSVFAVDE